MRSFFSRLLRRLDPPVLVQPSFDEQLKAKVEAVVAKWQEAVRLASTRSYLAGHAAGELAGRQALANELMVAHGVEGGEKPMSAEELATLGTRQLH